MNLTPAQEQAQSSATAAVEPPASPAPDWEHVDEEIHCPLCEYNLRGLIEPRCPECGYRFAWPELLDPTKRLHPYLFEHHPERNFKSFCRTLVGGLRPRRFWKSLLPVQPSFLRRLLIYWLVATSLYSVVVAGAFAVGAVNDARRLCMLRPTQIAVLSSRRNMRYRQSVIKEYGSVQAYLDAEYPLGPSASYVLRRLVSGEFLVAGTVLLVWPWLTFATLMIFQISMHRARVRPIHVLRCVVYTYDLVVWASVACVVAMMVRYALGSTWTPYNWIGTILLAVAGALVIAFYRLWMAYRVHLRFEHAFATILASQVITVLLLATLLGVVFRLLPGA